MFPIETLFVVLANFSISLTDFQSISAASTAPPVTEMTELKPCLKKNNNGSIGVGGGGGFNATASSSLLPANNGSVGGGGGVSPGSAAEDVESGCRRTSNVTTVEKLEDDHGEEGAVVSSV